MSEIRYLRRGAAGEYLKGKFGFGSARSLAKLATTGGGPVYRRAGRLIIYLPADLDEWATAKISEPQSSHRRGWPTPPPSNDHRSPDRRAIINNFDRRAWLSGGQVAETRSSAETGASLGQENPNGISRWYANERPPATRGARAGAVKRRFQAGMTPEFYQQYQPLVKRRFHAIRPP